MRYRRLANILADAEARLNPPPPRVRRPSTTQLLPLADAPTDGRPILVWVDDAWGWQIARWQAPWLDLPGYWLWARNDHALSRSRQPLGWLTLPARPERS